MFLIGAADSNEPDIVQSQEFVKINEIQTLRSLYKEYGTLLPNLLQYKNIFQLLPISKFGLFEQDQKSRI
jgi:hypothetical protein